MHKYIKEVGLYKINSKVIAGREEELEGKDGIEANFDGILVAGEDVKKGGEGFKNPWAKVEGKCTYSCLERLRGKVLLLILTIWCFLKLPRASLLEIFTPNSFEW